MTNYSTNMSQKRLSEHNNQQLINFFKLILKNLWIIIISAIIALGIAFIYNKYTIPSYRVSSTILIKDNYSNFNDNNNTYKKI